MTGSWQSNHEHVFGQDQPAAGERRTIIVVVITGITMIVEIAAGMVYGSMALLADGLHMAPHAVALGIAAFAYRYARKHAADPCFSFGTGKGNALAGYSGAVLLGVLAALLGRHKSWVSRRIALVEALSEEVLEHLRLGLTRPRFHASRGVNTRSRFLHRLLRESRPRTEPAFT